MASEIGPKSIRQNIEGFQNERTEINIESIESIESIRTRTIGSSEATQVLVIGDNAWVIWNENPTNININIRRID